MICRFEQRQLCDIVSYMASIQTSEILKSNTSQCVQIHIYILFSVNVWTTLDILDHCFFSIVHLIVSLYRGMYLYLVFDSPCCVADTTICTNRLGILPGLGVCVDFVESQWHNRCRDKIVPMNERNSSFDSDHLYLVDRDTTRPTICFF